MKTRILLTTAFLSILVLLTTANAFTITSPDSLTALHNYVLPINITVNNSGFEAMQNMTITATDISNQSNILSTSASNISAGQVKVYTLNYTIPQYTYAKAYPITINISGQNMSGNMSSAAKTITITVNENKGLSSSATAMSVSSAAGTTKQATFAITNTGNVNLTNITVTQQTILNDSDNNIITLSITSDKNLQALAPGNTATIFINATVPNSQQRKTYSTNLLVNSSEGIGATIAYQITIKESYCELGNKGSYLTVDIKEPDNGDDFYPNDEIPVMVRVKNTDNDERDVIVRADLYDETDDQFLDVEYETDATIGDDSSEDFEFTLKVPLDIINTHDFRIYAKVYEDGEEESQCYEDYISTDLKKESHSLLIDKVEMPSTAKCDDSIEADVKLANAGKNDEEDVKLEVINSELGISEEKLFNLDTGEARTSTLAIKIPKNTTEKDYTITIRASYYLSNDEYKKDVQAVKTVKVSGNCMPVIENTVVNAEVLNTAVVKEQLGIKLTIFNTGTSTATYNVAASGYETWATLDKVEPATVTVEAGRSESSYVYLTPLENTAGAHTITLKAMWGSRSLTKTITIPVTEKMTPQSAYQKISQRLSNLSGFDLATVNIVLVVAIVLVFAWIMRVRRAY
ncbi:putative S-layer protein [Candidatus Pacearchaeota archaeon]|nr:putative S-layer protein [Candidatus Pacearchaeota archaeon]